MADEKDSKQGSSLMDKKPGLLLAVSLTAIIILAAAFHMGLGGNAPIHLPNGVNPDNVLYVCPIGFENTWTQFSTIFHRVGNYVYLFFLFMILVLMFSWGWALYQNLLKDKFNADVYKNAWDLTKVVFWMAVVAFVLFKTPNYFRSVDVRGRGTNWVLCENTSDGARATWPKNVEVNKF